MAIVKAVITYSVPEDTSTDNIRLYSATSKNGTYSLVGTYDYDYGHKATEFTAIDTTKWYKINFYNSKDGTSSPQSAPIYGNDFDKSRPFAAFSTTFDGSSYASATGLYLLTNLSEDDVDTNDVNTYLVTARSYIDLVMGDANDSVYKIHYNDDISRRKYKAQLNIMEQAEIYLAAALIYKNLADDKIMEDLRLESTVPSGFIAPDDVVKTDAVAQPSDISLSDDLVPSGLDTFVSTSGVNNSISIGQTSIGSSSVDSQDAAQIEESEFELNERIRINEYNDDKTLKETGYNDERELAIYDHNDDKAIKVGQYNFNKNIKSNEYNLRLHEYQHIRNLRLAEYLDSQSKRYASLGNNLLMLLLPVNIPTRYNANKVSTSKFINPTEVFVIPTQEVRMSSDLTQITADLTGLGSNFNNTYYALSAANMASNPVDGTNGANVIPTNVKTAVADYQLLVNGMSYHVNSYIDEGGTLTTIDSGTDGFDIDFDTSSDYVRIKWNNVAASGGFDLADSDETIFKYWEVS